MVTLVVTVDEELLRRIETSVHPDLVTERTAYAEVGEATEPGELALSKFRPNGSLETQTFTIDLSDVLELTSTPEKDSEDEL